MMTAPKRNSRNWTLRSITWEGVLEMLKNPADHKECGNYLMGKLRGTRRNKDTVVSRGILALDSDGAPEDFIDLLKNYLGETTFAAHTTFSSTPQERHWRALIPLSRDVTPAEYRAAVDLIMDGVGREFFDSGSHEPERYMFRPAAQDPKNYQHISVEGKLLNPDEFLKGLEEEILGKESMGRGTRKRDPRTLGGAAGAFNRVFDFDEAIEEYDLPYEWVDAQRWILVGSSSEPGLQRFDGDLFVQSYHENDPALGEVCSAFDLVRLHRFKHLDAKAKPNTPVHKLPSHQAMEELAIKNKKVQEEVMGDDFSDEIPDDASDLWTDKIRLNPKTGIPLDVSKNWELIRDNDSVLLGISENVLSLAIETKTDFPWRGESMNSTLTPADWFELQNHIENTYRIRPAKEQLRNMVLTRGQRNSFNPVLEYLSKLEWDGVERLETCLPGVKPTSYSRMVARKCLAAAVARAYEPGIKWDHILVLQGGEGIGKTGWIDAMARGFKTTLGRLDSKDTLLSAHQAWIVTADEGHVFRQSESEALKEFMTRTHDEFRRPYAEETLSYPRRFVVWSTTNDKSFLRDEDGNRRYLPVQCEYEVSLDSLTDEYVGQIWAEAKHVWFNEREPLFLDRKETTVAKDVQREFTEDTGEMGEILMYLERLVPKNWGRMSVEERKEWIRESEASDSFAEKGTKRIMRVCSKQIAEETSISRTGGPRIGDLRRITFILDKLPGWTRAKGRPYGPVYGQQIWFERNTTERDLEDLI